MNTSYGKSILRSLLVSYIFTAVLLIVLAILLYQFRLGEKQVTLAVNASYVLTCLLGGFISGKSIRRRRFFWGALTGILYFLILLAVSYGLQKGSLSDPQNMMKTFLMCLGGGMIGGMLS